MGAHAATARARCLVVMACHVTSPTVSVAAIHKLHVRVGLISVARLVTDSYVRLGHNVGPNIVALERSAVEGNVIRREPLVAVTAALVPQDRNAVQAVALSKTRQCNAVIINCVLERPRGAGAALDPEVRIFVKLAMQRDIVAMKMTAPSEE